MVATQVNHLTRALSDLDLILKRTDDLCLEQKFQAAQMRRMEERLASGEKRLDSIEKEMELVDDDIQRVKGKLELMEKNFITRIGGLDKMLLLICKKLDINPIV